MKLDKAIELNQDSEKSLRDHKFTDYADAVRLGIEALKAFRQLRRTQVLSEDDLLPGEDPEPPTRRSLHHIRAVQESPLGKEPQNQHSGPKRL